VLEWPLWARTPAYLGVFYAITLFGRSDAVDFVYFQF
jgi:hypothetical protein